MEATKRRTGELARAMASHFQTVQIIMVTCLVVLILSALSFAAFIVGSLKISQCAIQPWIPVWLIVDGVTEVARSGVLIASVKSFFIEIML